MTSRDELQKLLHQAAQRPMTEAEIQEQRESWVRAMTTPCEHGELDFEQCPECRSLT